MSISSHAARTRSQWSRVGLLVGVLSVSATLFPSRLTAQTLELTAQPASATIFLLKPQDNSLVPIGVGSAKIKLEKDGPNTVVVRQEGFRDLQRSFPKTAEYKDKRFTLALTRRIVQVTAEPYDANIFVNGERKGQRALEVDVEEGQATTVEVKKTGFATLKRVYRWEKAGTDMPPARDRLQLMDRIISITASPSGTELFKDETKMGDGDADLVVPHGGCATVRAQKAGWAPVERQYCSKDGIPEPPIADRLALTSRMVTFNAPDLAKIYVDEKYAGSGAFALKIPEGDCVKVRVEQPSFLPFTKEYCVRDNAQVPPLVQPVALIPDDSFAASVASDQANVNITLEVAKLKTEEQAWKLLSSIVLSHFDVLENSDSQTGYLRTAWQLKSYGDGNQVVIRTRIIVKRVGDEPLRYSVKIVSERNKFAGVSVKEDENFIPWDRLLNTYKDVVSEMQARLK